MSCGASGSSFFRTRTILRSSAISRRWFCSRPAVSIRRRSSASLRRFFQGVEGEARRVGACGRLISGTRPVGPDLQLLDRGGAEGVAGDEHHLRAGGAELAAILPSVVVLPEPFTPTRDHLRPLGVDRHRARHRLQDSRDLAGEESRGSPRAPTRRPKRPSAMAAATLSEVSTPMSDWISSSSRLSSMASSSALALLLPEQAAHQARRAPLRGGGRRGPAGRGRRRELPR